MNGCTKQPLSGPHFLYHLLDPHCSYWVPKITYFHSNPPPKKRQIKSVSKMVVNLCQLNLFHLWLLYIYYIHGFGRRSFQKHPVLASWQGHRNSSSLRLEILLELQDVYADSKCRWAIPWQNTANLKHNGPVEILDLPLSQILIFQFANSWFTGFTG